VTSETLINIVEEEDPIPVVWDELWDIWAPAGSTVQDHYGSEREQASVQLERVLLEVYSELYHDELPWRCVNDTEMEVPEDGTFIVMDGMSVREAALFVKDLQEDGYDLSVDHSYATVPSNTTPYKQSVNYSEKERDHNVTTVTDQDPQLNGDEEIVWCRFPDSLIENIQEGKTKLSDFEEAYQKTVTVLRSLLSQLETDRAVVGSDHGYVRLDGYSIPIGDSKQDALKSVFGGDRSATIDEADAENLVDQDLMIESDGYYSPTARYTWPIRGKYSVYEHGGMSLVECLTPRIEVKI
jgi:hypothetical protein